MSDIVAFEKVELDGTRVTTVEAVSPADVRKKLNFNRPQFAHLIGVSERTLEGWEQGRTKPTGAVTAPGRRAESQGGSRGVALRTPASN